MLFIHFNSPAESVSTNRCPGPRPCSSSAGGSYPSDRLDHSHHSLSLGSVQRQEVQCVRGTASVHKYYIIVYEIKLQGTDLMNDKQAVSLLTLLILKCGRELLG